MSTQFSASNGNLYPDIPSQRALSFLLEEGVYPCQDFKIDFIRQNGENIRSFVVLSNGRWIAIYLVSWIQEKLPFQIEGGSYIIPDEFYLHIDKNGKSWFTV